MEVWRAGVEAALAGSGSVVELVGEPGVGKSRLVEEFGSVTGAMDMLSVACEYYQSSTPYGALRVLVRGLLGLQETTGALTAAQLGGRVGRAGAGARAVGAARRRRRGHRRPRHRRDQRPRAGVLEGAAQ